MDEVLKIRKELEKAMPRNDSKRALELLKSLESIPMTLDVLQKTHIGMAVNKMRKAVKNPEVSSLSKSMVKRWKKLLSSATSSNNNSSSGGVGPVSGIVSNNSSSIGNNSSSNNNNSGTNANAADTPTTSSNASNSAAATTITTTANIGTADTNAPQINQDQPQQAPPASKGPTPMQTEVPFTNSEVRIKCRQLLTEALKKPLPKDLMQEPFLEEDILAARIEECIYQEFKITDTKYKNRFRSRVANLGDVKNPYLRFKVLTGDISPEMIAKMSADEMASDELKKQREIYTKEAINDHQMTLTTGTKTSEIKCPACKKFNVTYNQVQTRSADEPMTTFCYCNECGKRWKFC